MAVVLKCYKIFKYLLVLTILLSFSYSYNIIEYNYLDFIKEESISADNVNGGLTYKISYEKGQISQNYIRIITIPNPDEFLYLYYSPISEKREDAFLLNSGKDEISLYINKGFTKLEADGEIYLTIACFSSTCSFEFTILELDEIDLARDGQYTYYITDKKNLQNTFKIFRSDTENEEGHLTFWATGSKDVQMNVKYVDGSTEEEKTIGTSELENGKYAFIKEADYPVNYEENSSMNYFIIEISSTANSLITVGSNLNLMNNNNKITKFVPNNKEIYGILNNNSPKQCFDFGIQSTQNYKYHLNILDFQRNIFVTEINKNEEEISNHEIKDGKILIIITNENAGNYYCLNKKNKDDFEATFSLQVIYDIDNNYYKNIYSPQINGQFYERFLEAGQLAFYTGLSSMKFKTELRYYLKINSGFPEMYFVKCQTFPYCKFDINNLPLDTIKPTKINEMSSYSIYKTEITNSISPEQYVLLVYCNIDESCSFETNFYNELDKFILPKEKKIYQTIMNEGNTNFVIKLDGEDINYKQVFVDFLTYSGDINIKYESEGFTVREYIAGNKKYFVLDKTSNNLKSTLNNVIYFYVSGEMASYYSVHYKLIVDDSDKRIMLEESGINYLETIEPKIGFKTITLVNSRPNNNRNFLVNFFPLNCEIEITRKINGKEKKLQNIDYLSQDIILNTEEEYNSEKYDYYMKIVKMDNVTKFDTNYCMVYVSSIEENVNSDSDYYYRKRQLLVSEGVINQVILSKSYPQIDYIYPHIYPSGYVVINLNMETNSKINIKINIENKKYKEINTGSSQYFIIEESVLRSNEYCPLLNTRPNQICNIIIEITLDSEFYDDEPVIEFNIKSKETIPAFIKKSMLRKDIIVGNSYQYYFTEIGKKEEGNININFERGSGNVYGRIVQKNVDEGSGWMKRFILPDKNNNQLKYDYYTKKIFYNEEDSQNCDYGCYLFIKVEPYSSDEYYYNENIAYPITLSINSDDASISTFTQDLFNAIDIPINEYIIGDTIPESWGLNNFYTFWIPYDCEEIIFEFIGDSTFILINIGNTKPIIDGADFSLNELGQDNILRITKNQILNKITSSDIKNVQLTIAVGAKYIDNKESSLYSFRIRALRKDEIELIELNNDQKTLCDIEGKSGNCYFIIQHHRKIDEQNNFFFHALELPNVEFNYYAYEVNKDYIINRNYDEIKKILDNKDNAKWSNKNSKGNYLYIDNSEINDKDNGVYILLNVEINTQNKKDNEITIISLLHTAYSYKGTILPNPSGPQLFILNNNNLNELFLDYEAENQNLIINIKLISGKGKVFWDLSDDIIINENKSSYVNSEDENTYYYLNNLGDSLSLTIGNSEIFPLHFINSEPNTGKKDSNNQPGFGFYIYFERESQDQNYHNLPYGGTSLFSLKDTDFPYIFYTKLPDKSHEVELIFKINPLKKKASYNYLKSGETENEIPLYDEFEINGLVLDEDFIYKKKSQSELMPDDLSKALEGVYDPIDKIFRIQFTSTNIEDYKIDGNNYLYIIIKKGNNNNQIYTEATLESNVLPSNNDGYYSKMNEYIYGKIPYNQKGYSRYELTRINSLYKYIRIEFSSNYDKINFALNYHKTTDSDNIDYYNNKTEFLKSEFYNGKSIVILEFKEDDIKGVYLSVFNTNNDHLHNEKLLSNFIFKYEVKEINDFSQIKPEKDEVIDYKYERSALSVTLPKILGLSSQSQINYLAKLIPADVVVKNENLYTISLIESQPIQIYSKSQNDFDETQKMELIDLHKDKVYYVILNCEILDNNNEEKFAFKFIYNPTDYQEEEPKEEESKGGLIAVMIIIIVFACLAIIFVILFLYLKRTNLRKSIQLQELNQKLNENNVLDDGI